jgi:hypothetical protein
MHEAFIDGFEKSAVLGIGMRVKNISDDGDFGVNIGFPYLASLDYRLTDTPLAPTVGVGFLGPYVGASYRPDKKKSTKKHKR